MDQKLLQEIKSGEVSIDNALYPEVHISQIPFTDLKIDVIPSGFVSLDDCLFLKKNEGELIILGGRPSMGKSAFMFQMACFVAKQHPVHIFSLEMSKRQIITRQLAGKLKKDTLIIQKGIYDQKAANTIRQEINQLQCYIDDRGGLHINELANAAINAHKRHKIGAIFIDYMQMIRTDKEATREREVSKISADLKNLAKELSIPIIVASQLSRSSEFRGAQTGNYRPCLADLRDSGSIEQDADIVAFVHRQYKYTKERRGEADIIIAKNRNGRTEDVVMDFIDNQCLFIDRGVEI